ncbi:MAG: helix-turn-helix domain-containing protein [Bryobacteraceae bacterium]|nr:helix-turn-helix domain-containing protein [Bryobacteraceae bacterium]
MRQVSESQIFRRAPAMRALLLYLWEHRREALSEYAVGIEALGRKPDFDPKFDATVRVQVSRLRQKLKEFYETEGRESELRLTIPLGSHQLNLIQTTPEPAPVAVPVEAPVSAPAAEPAAARRPRYWLVAAGMAVIAVVGLAYQNLRLSAQLREVSQTPELPPFWRSFLAGSQATSLVLPTPIFFYWEDRRLVVRDSHVNEYSQRSASSQLRTLEAQFGTPSVLQHYTVAADTIAALKLSQYLEQHGRHLWIASAPELPVDSFGDRNLIFLGSPGTSEHLQQILNESNFFIVPGTTGIVRNRAPAAGEAAVYAEAKRGDRRSVVPGIVSVFPGKTPRTKMLLLSSRTPATLVAFLMSPQGLEVLDRRLREAGSPEHYECVVLAEVEGTSVLKTSLAALRRFHPTH